MPISYAKKSFVLPLRKENGAIIAATSEPLNLAILDDLQVLFSSAIALVIAPSEKILDAINRLHSEDLDHAEGVAEEMEEEDLSFLAAELEEPTDLLDTTDDAP
ncbi:MAG TPA: type II secretion system protein GspE, partial [Nitrospiraceae bacterium]|nr:type II secretion system protein GspE [Nitrospiraceae bacterium]